METSQSQWLRGENPEEAIKGSPPPAYVLQKISENNTTYTYQSQTVDKRNINAIQDILVAAGEPNVRYSFPQTLDYGAD